MKNFYSKLIGIFALAAAASLSSCSTAHAQVQPNNVTLQQRNGADTGYIQRFLSTPAAGANGIIYYNGATSLPGYVVLGAGLSIMDGVLSATSTGSTVSADWNATSGPARILNKPSFATVAYSGQAGDLTGLAPVALTGQFSDLAGVPALATVARTGAYSDLVGRPTLAIVATSGSYNDLTDRPSVPAAYTFDVGLPSARAVAVSTAYQASNPGKAARVTISPQCTASLSLLAGSTCSLQARVASGSVSCSTGAVLATWTNGNTGTLTIGLGLNQTMGAPYGVDLPIGAAFILCPVSGTFTIAAAEQTIG